MPDLTPFNDHPSPDYFHWLHSIRARIWPKMKTWFAPNHLQHYRAWVFQGYIFISLFAFTILALFASVVTYFHFDLKFTLFLQQRIPAWFGSVLYWVSFPGNFPNVLVTLGILSLILLTIGLRWEVSVAILAAIASTLVNTVIKITIRRPRPVQSLVDVVMQLSGYSFPSGHVMFYATFFGFFAFLSFTMIKRTLPRAILTIFFALLVLLVGLSRIYMGEHWASDVIGGYLLGFLILVATIRVYRWGLQRKISNEKK